MRFFIFMKLIPLTQGQYAMVDDEDYEYLNQWKWLADKKVGGGYYAKRHLNVSKNLRTRVIMHRVIMNCPEGLFVDHKDRNGLNNQKSNLRICTQAENSRNKSSARGSSSKYLGVSRIIKKTKFKGTVRIYWHAAIRINYKAVHLGMFKNEDDAAKAYDAAAKKQFGEFANLNFKE